MPQLGLQTDRGWRRFLKRTLVGTGITLPQLDVLRALAANGRLHPSEIAVLLDCDRPTVSIMLGLPGRSRFDPLGCLDDGERASLVVTLERLVAHAEGAPWTGVSVDADDGA